MKRFIQSKILIVMLTIANLLPGVLPLLNISSVGIIYKIFYAISLMALSVLLYLNFTKSDNLELMQKYRNLIFENDGLFDGEGNPWINYNLNDRFTKKELKKLEKLGYVKKDKKSGNYVDFNTN